MDVGQEISVRALAAYRSRIMAPSSITTILHISARRPDVGAYFASRDRTDAIKLDAGVYSRAVGRRIDEPNGAGTSPAARFFCDRFTCSVVARPGRSRIQCVLHRNLLEAAKVGD